MKRLNIVVIIMILFCTIYLYPVVFANRICTLLDPEQCEDTDTTTILDKVETIGTIQIKAATAFLAANKAYQKYLEKYEYSTLDVILYYSTQEQSKSLNNAIYKITIAEELFNALWSEFQKYPLDKTKIEMLKRIDYNDIIERYQLNTLIMRKLEESLTKGDIYAVLENFAKSAGKIRLELIKLKYTVDQREPNIDTIYIINQLFADMSLYGQYSAMVFREIKAE